MQIDSHYKVLHSTSVSQALLVSQGLQFPKGLLVSLVSLAGISEDPCKDFRCSTGILPQGGGLNRLAKWVVAVL